MSRRILPHWDAFTPSVNTTAANRPQGQPWWDSFLLIHRSATQQALQSKPADEIATLECT